MSKSNSVKGEGGAFAIAIKHVTIHLLGQNYLAAEVTMLEEGLEEVFGSVGSCHL